MQTKLRRPNFRVAGAVMGQAIVTDEAEISSQALVRDNSRVDGQGRLLDWFARESLVLTGLGRLPASQEKSARRAGEAKMCRNLKSLDYGPICTCDRLTV